MRNIILSVTALAFVFLFLSSPSFAAKRYASCDLCGLCPSIVSGTENQTCTVAAGQKPGDWESCVKCIYPNLFPQNSSPNPTTCSTLEIDPATSLPLNKPAVGRQYTMIGCIASSSEQGFLGTAGAPTFVQKILNVMFSLAGALSFLYLMYGGFIYITSQADPERLNYGKRLIYGAIVGLIVTLGSVFLVNIVASGFLRIPGFS